MATKKTYVNRDLKLLGMKKTKSNIKKVKQLHKIGLKLKKAQVNYKRKHGKYKR